MSVYDNLVGMEEVLDEFIVETSELLEGVNEDLVHLESEPDGEKAKAMAHRADYLLNQHDQPEEVAPAVDNGNTEVKGSHVTYNSQPEEDEELMVAEEAAFAVRYEDPTASAYEPTHPSTHLPTSPPPKANGDQTYSVASSAAADHSTTAHKEKNDRPAWSVQIIRVDLERLENLMNLEGELLLSLNQLGQAYANLSATKTGDGALDNLDQVNNSLGRLTTEIQVVVMQMHMLPISNVFRKFPRVVRYLSQELGLNENIDGLIRQCCSKGRGSATITDSETQIVIDKLNNCPRKCLRFKTPNQVFFGIKSDVALLYGLPKYYHSGVK